MTKFLINLIDIFGLLFPGQFAPMDMKLLWKNIPMACYLVIVYSKTHMDTVTTLFPLVSARDLATSVGSE